MKTREVYEQPLIVAVELDVENPVLQGSGVDGEGSFEGSDGWGDE